MNDYIDLSLEWLLNHKQKVLNDLQRYYENTLDLCGPDDEIYTIPAKKMFENTARDFEAHIVEIKTFYEQGEHWDKEAEAVVAKAKIQFKKTNESNYGMLMNALARFFLKHDWSIPIEDKDELKKFVFLVVKAASYEEFSKSKKTDEDSVIGFYELLHTHMNAIGHLTPHELMQIFPITKEYDGIKYGCKDYFYTMDVVNKHGKDNIIGSDNVFNFLYDYDNIYVREFLVVCMSSISALYKLQTGKNVMEEFFKEHGIDAYTYDAEDGYLINNRTGQITKTSKPEKRVPNWMKRIKQGGE